MKFAVTCTDFRPLHRNTLRGFATVKLPDLCLTIRDIAVHQHSGGSRWAQLPARPMLDNAGAARRNSDGKIEYAAMFEFEGREVRDAFSAAVVRAVLDFNPAALNAE